MKKFIPLISGLILFISTPTFAFNTDEVSILNTLKNHYEFVEDLNNLSVSFKGKRRTTFQSDNYLKPYTIKSLYEYQYDLDEKQFYFHDQHVYPGNYIFDENIVHKNGKTILYDRNGFTKGKQLQYLDYNLTEFKEDLTEDLDLLAAHSILAHITNENTKIKILKEQVILTLKSDDKEKVNYTFSLSPIQLTSIAYPNLNVKTVFSKPITQMNITFASSVKHFKDNKLKNDLTLYKLKKISGINQAMLEIPKGYGPFVDEIDNPLRWVELATDLYLINYVAGDRHVLVKESKNGLTVFGAPRSSKVSEQVISFINKHLPNKNIDSVYITHAHSDHMGGLNYYANKGISIIADQYSINVIKAYPKFSEVVNNWKFTSVKHKQSLNNAIFYVPKNSHSDGQSFVYFPTSKIIYQGDFLEIPFDNSLPTHMADVEKEFIDFLRVEKINYNRIVGHHRNNNMTPKVVNAYYSSHHNL